MLQYPFTTRDLFVAILVTVCIQGLILRTALADSNSKSSERLSSFEDAVKLNKLRGGSTLENITSLHEERMIICNRFNFNSLKSMKLLENLMEITPIKDYDTYFGFNVFTDSDKNLVGLLLPNSSFSHEIDISFVYVHQNSLLDENALLLQFQSAFKAVLEGTSRKSLVLVIDATTPNNFNTIARRALNLLEESWILFEKSPLLPGDLSEYLDIAAIFVSGNVIQPGENTKLKKILSKAKINSSLISRISSTASSNSAVSRDRKDTSVSAKKIPNQSVGMTSSMIAYDEAVEWAREAIQASFQRLQKSTSTDEFGGFMKELLSAAVRILTENAKSQGAVSSVALNYATNNLKREIYRMMTSLYNGKVQLIRQKAAQQFNALAVNNLEVSVYLEEDLIELRDDALNYYDKEVRKLRPSEAPPEWDMSLEIWTFKQSLDDFIVARCEQERLIGVLPRDRAPVSVSAHAFVLHPFGREYRQAPLGMTDGDDLIYDDSAARDASDELVRPSTARRILVKSLSAASTDDQSKRLKKMFSAKDSEFAREMLMFPLSVKNPSGPLMSGRAGRRQARDRGLTRDDAAREREGPERCVLCYQLDVYCCVTVRCTVAN